MSTLLPEPERPMMHVTWPSGIVSVTSCSTVRPPKRLDRSRISITGSVRRLRGTGMAGGAVGSSPHLNPYPAPHSRTAAQM